MRWAIQRGISAPHCSEKRRSWLKLEIGMTPGPSQIDGFFCYQTYYSQSCSGANCSIGAWFYNPCQGTSFYGVSTFAMPTTVSFSDTWDNQCATLEARSQ